jgi:hypothetical protein
MSIFTEVLEKARLGRSEIKESYQKALDKRAEETEEIKKTLDVKFKQKGESGTLLDQSICLKKLNKVVKEKCAAGVLKGKMCDSMKMGRSYFSKMLRSDHQISVKYATALIEYFGDDIIRDNFNPVLHKPKRWVNPRFNTLIDCEKLIDVLKDTVIKEHTSLSGLAIKHGYAKTKYNHIVVDKPSAFTHKTANALLKRFGKCILKDEHNEQ